MRLGSLICRTGLAVLLAPALAISQNGQTELVADARPADVRVYATSAIRVPLEAVAKQAEQAIGKHIVFEYGSARGNLRQKIMAGSGDFELAILLPDVDDALLAAGKIKPGAYEIARVPTAFGLRGNAKVDVSTPEAIRQTLLGAASVKYSPTGVALLTVKKVLGDLQIADKIKDMSGTGPMNEVPLKDGEYEININPLSEVLPHKGWKNLGPVVDELQVPSIIEATIGKNTRDATSANALLRFLQGPAIDVALKSDGMEKGKVGLVR